MPELDKDTRPEPGPAKRAWIRFAALSPLTLFVIGALLLLNQVPRPIAELAGLCVLLITVGAGWQAIWDPEMRFIPLSFLSKASIVALTIGFAALSTFLHCLFVAGWCGDFDDGPVGQQTAYCHSAAAALLSFVPGVLFTIGAALAMRARTGTATFISLLLGFGTGSAFAAVVPFLIVSRG